MVEDTFVSFVPTSSGDCANAIYISLRVLKNTRYEPRAYGYLWVLYL